MEIVKFKCGEYGIRKGFFFKSYINFRKEPPEPYRWCSEFPVEWECKHHNLEFVIKVFQQLQDEGTPVTDIEVERKQKDKTLGKYNDWCCKQGSPVNISHCKLHGMKQVKTT